MFSGPAEAGWARPGNVQKTTAGKGKLFRERKEKFSRAGARTRWVTERIAPIGTAPESIRRNEGFEQAGQNESQAVPKKPRNEKMGTKNFLPVDTRPNG